MNIPQNVLVVLLLVSITLASTASAKSYQSGHYPQFTHAQLFSNGGTVSNRPNGIQRAIENNSTLKLSYDNQFRSAKDYIFPSNYFGDSYNAERLMSKEFVASIQQVVSEFACAEYRFRKHQPEQPSCNGFVDDKRNFEKMPFVSGQYTQSRIEVHRDDRRNRVSFNTYLSSSSEMPLKTAFGAVHELGTFFGRMAHRKSLVLSVKFEARWLDGDGFRASPVNSTPVTYFIVIPRSTDIANQNSQSAAAKFAVQQAKLILIK